MNINSFSLCSRELYSDKKYAKWRTGYDYPQNHLRNIAREASLTQYTMSLDVDVILAPDMTETLAKFLNGNTCAVCAYVIPTYEVDQREQMPRNKSQLAHLVERKLAQPFHSKIFVHNQFATNFSK